MGTEKAVAKNDATKEIEILRAQLAAANAKLAKQQTIVPKVSPKGAVQMSGFGRFPVTLYAEQLLRLLDAGPSLRIFVETHRSELSFKGAADAAPAPEAN